MNLIRIESFQENKHKTFIQINEIRSLQINREMKSYIIVHICDGEFSKFFFLLCIIKNEFLFMFNSSVRFCSISFFGGGCEFGNFTNAANGDISVNCVNN